MDNAELERQLGVMRQAYRTRLPERLDMIAGLWSQLEVEGWQFETARELRQQLHRLAGSGATFGMPELGNAARNTELALRSWLASEPPAEVAAELAALFAELRHTGHQSVDLCLTSDRPSQMDTRMSQAATGLNSGNGHTIVIVEDDRETAHELAAQLRHFGYEVHLAHNLANLPTLLGQVRPAVLVMDVMFPEGNLAGAGAVIAAQGLVPQPIPVIFISARDDFEARLAAVRARGQAYFVKPIHAGQLIDTIDRITGVSIVEPLRILCVDDDADLAERYALVLRAAGMTVRVVTDPRLAMAALRHLQADLLLLDLHMPGCTGIELATVIRQQEAYISLPIVFLSSETASEYHHAARDLGGDDVLTKPISAEALVHAVRARAQRARSMRALMVRDGLTGLLNHSATSSLLELEVERARRNQAPLTVTMVDLDRFKQINDTYGHGAGDGVLRMLARLLQQRLRRSDVIGRYGGEEFMIILPGTGGAAAVQVLDGIRSSFGALRHVAGPTSFYVTFSAGVAELHEHDNAVRLAQRADIALYEAKRRGRNHVCLEAPPTA